MKNMREFAINEMLTNW